MPRKLTDWLETYCTIYTEETESAKIYHKWVGMSMIAAVLRKKVRLKFGRFKVYPNLYVVLVGEPGVARKTQAISYGTKLLREVPGIATSADTTTPEAFLQDIELSAEDSQMADGTVLKHSSISVLSREFESFLGQKRDNTKMLVLLTALYDVEEIPHKYRTKGAGSNAPPAVYLNLLAATTPDSLASSLPPTAIGGGLTSRMVFVWAAGKYKKVPIPEDPPEEVVKNLIHDLTIISRIAGDYEFSPICKKQWYKWYYQFEEQDPNRICKDPAFGGWYSRKAMIILKIAQIISASRNGNMILEWNIIEEATHLLEEAERSMANTFSAVGRSDISVDVDTVQTIIKKYKCISEKDLLQVVWRDIDSRKFDNVVETLRRSGVIRRDYKGPKGETGVWYSWLGG